MVAGLAAAGEGKARFFVVQKRESQEAFIGRVTSWLKEQGSEGLQMLPPEVLPKGVEPGEVMMRLKHTLGLSRQPDAPAYDVENVDLTLQGGAKNDQPS